MTESLDMYNRSRDGQEEVLLYSGMCSRSKNGDMEGWTPALENLGKESDWIGGTEPWWVQERDWLKGGPNSSPEKKQEVGWII